MNKLPSIAIFDVGKTNKKLLLFDEQYKVVHEESVQLEEITDEDGFACEDINALTEWIKDSFDAINKDERFDIKALNFSAYGASFVYLDKNGKVLLPLYNYRKPYPQDLQRQFYARYGGELAFSKQTASPVLGSLNSGMQLYRLKYERPEKFSLIASALHLPQYLYYMLTGHASTDITSIGCHTGLWDFQNNQYHPWVNEEKVEKYFAPLLPSTGAIHFTHDNKDYAAGIGLHDSSAALIPYLASFEEPFILLSTGTWNISLNPFNHALLSDDELKQDCLCYLTYLGKPVKASRLFAGFEHEQQTKKLAAHFNLADDCYKRIVYDAALIKNLQRIPNPQKQNDDTSMVQSSSFGLRPLHDFETYEQAYHQLIFDIIVQQVKSTKIVLNDSPAKKIFVDGGFGKNPVFMNLLAAAFPHIEVHAATVAQASSLGAALAIHHHWNKNPSPQDLIRLKRYNAKKELVL